MSTSTEIDRVIKGFYCSMAHIMCGVRYIYSLINMLIHLYMTFTGNAENTAHINTNLNKQQVINSSHIY